MLFALFVLALFFVAGLISIILTIGLTLGSLVALLKAPSQLLAILRNQPVRRNHTLEHATINVIEQRYGRSRLSGLAQPGGFIVRGGAPAELVADAAQEALARLSAGERNLAIHPRCGTTLVAAQLVLAVAFLAVLVVTRELSFLPFLVGILAAVLLARRLSPLLQRFITTNPNIRELTITDIELQRPDLNVGMLALIVSGPVFVRTSQTGSDARSDRNVPAG
jgi:hypothetical protein